MINSSTLSAVWCFHDYLLAPGMYGNNGKNAISENEHFLRNCSQVTGTGKDWWLVNIGPGNGLVPCWAIVHKWLAQEKIDDKSILFQVMA